MIKQARDLITTITAETRSTIAFPGISGCLIAITMIAIGVRSYFLTQPMRFDEAFTFMHYVARARGGIEQIGWLFLYDYPNNHVLHTILVCLSTAFFGNTPCAIRLPAFLAGIATIPLIAILCRNRDRHFSGLGASMGCAVLPFLVLYGTGGRGYSLIVLFTVAALIIGARTRPENMRGASLLLAVVESLGLFTIPTMLFPVAGINLWVSLHLWLSCRRVASILRNFILPLIALTGLITCALYLPVIVRNGGIATLLNNNTVHTGANADPFWKFLNDIAPHTVFCWNQYWRDVPTAMVWVCVTLCAIGAWDHLQHQSWIALSLVPAVLAGTIILFIMKHQIPFDRTWIFLVPVAFTWMDAGYARLLDFVSRKAAWTLQAVALLAIGAYAISLASRDAIAHYPDTGSFEEAATVVDLFRKDIANGARIHAICPVSDPLFFYIQREGLTYPAATSLPNSKDIYVFKKNENPVELPAPPRQVLEFGDAIICVLGR